MRRDQTGYVVQPAEYWCMGARDSHSQQGKGCRALPIVAAAAFVRSARTEVQGGERGTCTSPQSARAPQVHGITCRTQEVLPGLVGTLYRGCCSSSSRHMPHVTFDICPCKYAAPQRDTQGHQRKPTSLSSMGASAQHGWYKLPHKLSRDKCIFV